MSCSFGFVGAALSEAREVDAMLMRKLCPSVRPSVPLTPWFLSPMRPCNLGCRWFPLRDALEAACFFVLRAYRAQLQLQPQLQPGKVKNSMSPKLITKREENPSMSTNLWECFDMESPKYQKHIKIKQKMNNKKKQKQKQKHNHHKNQH
jgi:hypothetical protein